MVQACGVTWSWCLVLVASFACANPGMPPGGPERHTPPVVIKTTPDTNATHVTVDKVMIKFDEVISERPSGNATKLGDLVLVSPRAGVGDVHVDWHRDNITIRPDKGWKPKTTYTVSVQPGIADLRGNILKTGINVVFSTGDSLVHSFIHGVVFNWLTGRPIPRAIVEAVPRPDSSLIYLAMTDSSGRFTILAPPSAQYTVRASDNTTQNHVFDSRMAYDSTSMALTDSAQVELLTFVHDSLGPSLTGVQVVDSVTLRATFNAPIDPRNPLDTSLFTLVGSDSSRVPILAIRPANQDTLGDSVRQGAGLRDSVRREVVRQDTVRRDTAHRDTTRQDTVRQDTVHQDTVRRDTTYRDTARNGRAEILKPSKPLLFQEVIITLGTPIQSKHEYRLETRNLRGPNGVAMSSAQTFTTPEPPPKPKPLSSRSGA